MVFSTRLALSACLAVWGVATCAHAEPWRSPLGTWLTESGHGVVAIESCGDALCGRIVGIDRAPGEAMPADVHGKAQCGQTIITDERPTADSTWLGSVTDPRSGTKYHAKIWVDESDNLHLHGYLGIPLLGQTQIWHRYSGPLTAECDMR